MDASAHKSITNSILTSNGDQAAVSSLLIQLEDDKIQDLAMIAQLQQQLDQLATENANLRQTNLDLFLRVPVTAGTPAAADDDDADKGPTIASLFDDKGMLL